MTDDATTLLALSVASALGAVLRHVVDQTVQAWRARRVADPAHPWGIAVVNLTGCLLLGLLAGATGETLASGPTAGWVLVAQVGLLGSYTTFSTWAVDLVRLLDERRPLPALADAAGSLLGGAALVVAGLVVGSALASLAGSG